jgi:SAM-dependent MidA family methyltransferase
MFIGFLRDVAAMSSSSSLDISEPLYIIELGTGSGKFSFYFVQWLEQMETILPFPLRQIRYIMTDFTDANVSFWKTHPALSRYVARGLIDFAIFDATSDTSLTLLHAQKTLTRQSLKNPLCIIANYLFDTLPHELFRVDAGVLYQGLISVGSSQATEPGRIQCRETETPSRNGLNQ